MTDLIDRNGQPIGQSSGNGSKLGAQIKDLYKKLDTLKHNNGVLFGLVGECQVKENGIIDRTNEHTPAIQQLGEAMLALNKRLEIVEKYLEIKTEEEANGENIDKADEATGNQPQ